MTQATQTRSSDTKAALILFISTFISFSNLQAQMLPQKIQKAFQRFESDSQLVHAISSLYVIDAANGEVVFDKHSTIGLAPASTQKIITSITALALLGKNFRYTTSFALSSKGDSLYVFPSGDPTLGSGRWENTKPDKVLTRISQALKLNPNRIGIIALNNFNYTDEAIPDGWIWQDIGNYYGATSGAINWRENQYDLLLQSGSRVGDPVRIVGTNPHIFGFHLRSDVRAASRGTGDNAYIYFGLNDSVGNVTGTIPVNENAFAISGAFPSASSQFCAELWDQLAKTGITEPSLKTAFVYNNNMDLFSNIHTEISPSLDSIIYWFNKRSINLYGEALLKTIAAQQKRGNTTDSGVAVIQDFWQSEGINAAELNIVDGSGLSPLNRVTTHAQVRILQYAMKQSWFPEFLQSLPVYNGITMKSGTIRNVKGYAGYHTNSAGKTFIFSFLVNNYNGSPSSLVNKMYVVLNMLK